MKIIKSLNSVTVSRPQKLPNQNVINITDAVYIERQDITEKQRQYKSEIERAYTLKTTGPNQGSINPPRLVQTVPIKIAWLSFPYYKVAGDHLEHPKDWTLTEGSQLIAKGTPEISDVGW
jgi:hypothetical protein